MVNHGSKLPRLGRGTAHRLAMLRNMVTDLFKHERIETTVTRAKALKRVAEQAITWGKSGNHSSFVRALGFVRTPEMVDKVFQDLATRYKHRPGGYTRVVRTRSRYGDNAPMAYVELVDRPGELRPARPVDAEYAAQLAQRQAEHEEKHQRKGI